MHQSFWRTCRSKLTHGAAASLMALAASFAAVGPAAAAPHTEYDISIDTRAALGQAGYVDLQFNPGTGSAPPATADLSMFATNAVLGSGPTVDGDVSGALPGSLQFGNGGAFNAYLQPLAAIGSVLSFHLSFGGGFLAASSGSGTAFTVALSGPAPDFTPYLQTDAEGRVLKFELSPGDLSFTAFDPGVTVTAVPEPSTYGTLIAGLVVIAWRARRRPSPRRRVPDVASEAGA